jgi:hypothetical protein
MAPSISATPERNLLAVRKERQQTLLDSVDPEQQRAGRLVDGFLGRERVDQDRVEITRRQFWKQAKQVQRIQDRRIAKIRCRYLPERLVEHVKLSCETGPDRLRRQVFGDTGVQRVHRQFLGFQALLQQGRHGAQIDTVDKSRMNGGGDGPLAI